MSAGAVATTAALTLLIVFAWSGVVSAVDAVARPPAPGLDERRARILLVLMIAPTIFGAIAAVVGSVAPTVIHTMPDLGNIDIEAAQAATPAAVETPSVDWARWIAVLGVGVYLAGAGAGVVRLTVQTARLRRIAVRARAVNEWGDDVAITSESVPPFAGLFGRVVVPQVLVDTLSTQQLAMIVEHERAHVRRGDTGTYLALAFIDALLWCIPFVRRQTNRCRLAAEIACDAAVTQSAPQLRDAYARTLVKVLKHDAGVAPSCAPTVFSIRNKGEHQTRIRQIMASVAPTRTRRGTAALMALAALTAPLAATQITIAQSTSAGPPDFSVTPIVGLPMNGLREGVHPLTGQPEFNRGVILSVSAGTPVVAPASGRVVLIMTHPGGFGDFVMLSHGAGYATCYGPLDAIAFAVGDDVAAGQRIAQVGSNVSGGDPFLFVEVSRDGAPLDPVSVLGISAAAS